MVTGNKIEGRVSFLFEHLSLLKQKSTLFQETHPLQRPSKLATPQNPTKKKSTKFDKFFLDWRGQNCPKIMVQIMNHLIFKVFEISNCLVLTTPTLCSFARRLAGKMTIQIAHECSSRSAQPSKSLFVNFFLEA